jgi:hypothetical protein
MDVQNVLARNLFVHKLPAAMGMFHQWWLCCTGGSCVAPVVAVELSVVSLESGNRLTKNVCVNHQWLCCAGSNGSIPPVVAALHQWWLCNSGGCSGVVVVSLGQTYI